MTELERAQAAYRAALAALNEATADAAAARDRLDACQIAQNLAREAAFDACQALLRVARGDVDDTWGLDHR